jgi:hypothetical protein
MQTFEKVCRRCLQPYIGTGRAQIWCPACWITIKRERDRDAWVSGRHRQRHGLTQERYDVLRARGCAICGNPFTETPHVDHDHRHCPKKIGCEECVRGLLCRFCNNGFIYAVESNPALRELVAPQVLKYIDKFQRDAADLLLN